MTQVVSHRGRMLLGACSVAAAMMFAQAGLARGAGGMGGAMMTQPRVTSLQPSVATAPHVDPSGHMPGVGSTGVMPVVRTPVTGSHIPVTTNQSPGTSVDRPTTEGQRPTLARRFFTPDGAPIAPPRMSSTVPTKVGGDPTTGTVIVDPPVQQPIEP